MFDQYVKRIGYACKTLYPDQSLKKRELDEYQRPLNTRGTTVKWLNEQRRFVAEQRLVSIMKHNISSFYKLVEFVSNEPIERRMVRLSSDCLPMYTQPDWQWFWKQPDIRDYCSREFAKIGDLARKNDVRLSMHPGQFCCLASDKEDVVIRSIDEFEYHVDMIRWMGYGTQFQDFKCNVHVSGKRGVDGIIEVLKKLTPEARNVITFENDEYSTGIDELVKLRDHAALVFDNHHHWINSGEHLQPNDSRYQKILDSWRGIRPVMHYSMSKQEYLQSVDSKSLPNLQSLLNSGHKRGKLRAHSDYYTNQALNDLVHEFREYSDIMCESKQKNLASTRLHEYFIREESYASFDR